MKRLTCEMCGGTDVVKQEGMYVCQTCGTKYSADEAKKMMIEGTVDVSGSTVRVDNSASVDNYYRMAESAYESGNRKESEQYCNKIIEIDPDNYKAWLLKGKAAGWQSTLANIRIEEATNCFIKAIDNAPEDAAEIVKKISVEETVNLHNAVMTLYCDNYSKYGLADTGKKMLDTHQKILSSTIKIYKKCDTDAKYVEKIQSNIGKKICEATLTAYQNIKTEYLGNNGQPSRTAWDYYMEKSSRVCGLLTGVPSLIDDNEGKINMYKNALAILKELEQSGYYEYNNGNWNFVYGCTYEGKQTLIDLMMDFHNKIKAIDPNYVIPEKPQPTKSGGCYIATAVYGSYDCPEVWTLRRFRDYNLAKTWYGRTFIHTYYAISPTLVKMFGETTWFKTIWKGKLDRMVRELNNKGFASTPYEDHKW